MNIFDDILHITLHKYYIVASLPNNVIYTCIWESSAELTAETMQRMREVMADDLSQKGMYAPVEKILILNVIKLEG